MAELATGIEQRGGMYSKGIGEGIIWEGQEEWALDPVPESAGGSGLGEGPGRGAGGIGSGS